jgi:hypothetical protein
MDRPEMHESLLPIDQQALAKQPGWYFWDFRKAINAW